MAEVATNQASHRGPSSNSRRGGLGALLEGDRDVLQDASVVSPILLEDSVAIKGTGRSKSDLTGRRSRIRDGNLGKRDRGRATA